MMKLEWYRKHFGTIHAKTKDYYFLISVDFAHAYEATEDLPNFDDEPEYKYVAQVMDANRSRVINSSTTKTIMGAKQFCQNWGKI